MVGVSRDPVRRAEVFEELVSHFEDGIAAGRSVEELLAAFGDESVTADLLHVVERQRHTPTAASPIPPPLRRRILGMMHIPRDVRYAVRRLVASPVFAITAVLSLALGIGATTMVFGLLNAVFLRPTPIVAPEELVGIYERDSNFAWGALSYPNYRDLKEATPEIFSAMGASRFVVVQQDDPGGRKSLFGEAVSGGYFPMLGLVPAAGRLLGPEDDVSPGAHAVIVLGHGYWQTAYGGDPEVVGRETRINGRNYLIVGVAPKEYQGGTTGIVPEFYASIAMTNHLNPGDSDEFQERGNHGIFVKGRLRPGVTMEQAEVVAAALASDIRAKAPDDWGPERTFVMLPASEVIVYPGADSGMRAISGVLLVVVGLVLLVVCANLASFLLARGLDRRREIAVRLALGATRGQLIRQLVTETVLLGVLGGAAGLGVAVLLGRLLTTADLPLPLPISVDLSLDWRVLTFTAVVSIVAGALLGLVPALRASRPELSGTLRDESAGATGGRHGALMSQVLVGAQVSSSLVLLVAAGLFVRSLQQQEQVDPGFGRTPTALVQVAFAGDREADVELRLARRLQEQRDVAARIRDLPGVTAVGMTDNIHLNLINQQNTAVVVPGVPPPAGADAWSVEFAVVDTGFFAAAGMRMVQGADFDGSETRQSPRVAVVNEAMARRFWPDQSAVGQQFARGGREYRVVGVVETAKIRTLGEAPRATMYTAVAQSGASSVWYVARTSGDDVALVEAVLGVVRAGGDDLIPATARTMTNHLGIMTLPLRLGVLTVASLALLAVILAAIGLYGSVSYAVVRRTREVGIRLALGAQSRAVIGLLMGGGLRVVAVGTVVGLALALLVARLMSGLLYGVRAVDPVTFVLVPMALLAVAGVAAWLPARRVLSISPSSALRTDA